MRSPGRTPTVSPSGTDRTVESRKPTTCTGSGSDPSSPLMTHIVPTLTRGPVDSIRRPTERTTRPYGGVVSIRGTRSMYESRENHSDMDRLLVRLREVTCVRRVFGADQRAPDFLELGLDADVEQAHVRFDAAGAAAQT